MILKIMLYTYYNMIEETDNNCIVKAFENSPIAILQGKALNLSNIAVSIQNYDEVSKFSDMLYNDLSFEKMITYILECKSELFKNGGLYIDEVFHSRNWKKLDNSEKIAILDMLNTYNARYSDHTYIEALWSAYEVQNWVKKNLPRKYSERHVEDTETY